MCHIVLLPIVLCRLCQPPISLYRPYCLTLHISNNRWRGEQSNETRTCYEHLLQRHRTNMRIAYMWLPGKTFDFVSQLPRHLSDALWSLNAKRSLTLSFKTRHIVVKKSKPYNTFWYDFSNLLGQALFGEEMFFMREIFLARKSGMRSSGGGASQSASQSVSQSVGLACACPTS